MNKYYLMNKILEEQGVCEEYLKLETDFADHEAYEFIKKMEDDSE